MSLRDEIAAMMRLQDTTRPDGSTPDDVTGLVLRAILELMDNRPAPVRIKLIRSATKEQNEGWEISADSNAVAEDVVNAMSTCIATRAGLITALDGNG